MRYELKLSAIFTLLQFYQLVIKRTVRGKLKDLWLLFNNCVQFLTDNTTDNRFQSFDEVLNRRDIFCLNHFCSPFFPETILLFNLDGLITYYFSAYNCVC